MLLRKNSYQYRDMALMRKQAIDANEETWMEASVYGAGNLSFYWMVSSQEGYDFLEFYIDDELQDAISGQTDWAQKQYTVSGSGPHILKWRYVKDYSGTAGDDLGWVDYLQWSGAAAPPPSESGDWETTTYTYDPAGRRIAKAFDGDVAARYLYDGIHCIAEYDANDTLLRKFVYGPGVDQPVCMLEAGGTYTGAYYYHFDGLGSVIALSDAAGDTVQTYEYSVYGQPAAADPNHPNPFLFTARRFDPETGLYHYRARAYNPYLGRFLQTDPARQGMNWYAYCGNNITNRVDPSGMIGLVPPPEQLYLNEEEYQAILAMGDWALSYWKNCVQAAGDLVAQGAEFVAWFTGEPLEYFIDGLGDGVQLVNYGVTFGIIGNHEHIAKLYEKYGDGVAGFSFSMGELATTAAGAIFVMEAAPVITGSVAGVASKLFNGDPETWNRLYKPWWNPKRFSKIFRNAKGHVPVPEEDISQIWWWIKTWQNIASNPANKVKDIDPKKIAAGVEVFELMIYEGYKIWVEVTANGMINNAGMNVPGE